MRKQVVVSFLMLVLGAICVAPRLHTKADIGERHDDPLIEALKKNRPPLWPENAANFAAIMEKEKNCTLIEFVKFDRDGKPDIQFDDAGRLLIHDKTGHKLAEVTKQPAARLKQDLAIVMARTNDDKLNSEARKQLNLALYGLGYENGPRTDADLARGAQRHKDGMLELSHYAAAKKVENLQAKWRQSTQTTAPAAAVRSNRQDTGNSGAGSRRTADTSQKASGVTRVTRPTAKPAVDGSIKQRTIDAYKAVYAVPAPADQLYSQDLIFRRNEIRKLDLRNVDPDLVNYLRLLDKQLAEAIAVLKPFEAEESRYRRAVAQAQYQEERYRIAHSVRDTPPDPGYLLRLRDDYNELVEQTNELQERIHAKYDPSMNAALQRLETKYGSTFHVSASPK